MEGISGQARRGYLRPDVQHELGSRKTNDTKLPNNYTLDFENEHHNRSGVEVSKKRSKTEAARQS